MPAMRRRCVCRRTSERRRRRRFLPCRQSFPAVAAATFVLVSVVATPSSFPEMITAVGASSASSTAASTVPPPGREARTPEERPAAGRFLSLFRRRSKLDSSGGSSIGPQESSRKESDAPGPEKKQEDDEADGDGKRIEADASAGADSTRQEAATSTTAGGSATTTAPAGEGEKADDSPATTTATPHSAPILPSTSANNRTASSSSPAAAVYILPPVSSPGFGLGGPGMGGMGGIHSSPHRLPGHLHSIPGQAGGQPGGSDSASAVASILVPILSTAVKLLLTMLLSGANPFASPESAAYSPTPSQHYMFERVNDRYHRDGAALRKALKEPPPVRWRKDKGGRRWWGARGWRRTLERREREVRRSLFSKRAEAEATMSASNGANNGAVGAMGQQQQPYRRTVILLEFNSDPNAPNGRHGMKSPGMGSTPHEPIETLRDQISFLLEQYHDPTVRPALGEEVEVVLCVESGGGVVQDYGLAADAVRRVRDAGSNSADDDGSNGGIKLTVCVDRVAASGGYMIACQSTPGRLFAAPFAILGSIGVVTERVNVHDLLSKFGVRGLVLKAGKDKAPLGTLGEVTEDGVKSVQRDLDRIHCAFRRLVSDARPDLLKDGDGAETGTQVEEIATGEVFLGRDAAELGLVDRIITSDEYVSERIEAGDRVLRLHRYEKPKFGLGVMSPLDLLLMKEGGAGGLGGLLGRCRSRLTSALSSPNAVAALRVGGAAMGFMGLCRDFAVGTTTRRRRNPRDDI